MPIPTDQAPLFEPNCDSVTNNELREAILSFWPNPSHDSIRPLWPYASDSAPASDLRLRIPVAINSPSASYHPASVLSYLRASLTGHSELIPYATDNPGSFNDVVMTLLKDWTRASDQRIEFYQADNLTAMSRGIFVNFCGSYAEFSQHDEGGITYVMPDRHGNILNALICLPEVDAYKQPAVARQAPFMLDGMDYSRYYPAIDSSGWSRIFLHEMGHALGLLHLHEFSSVYERLITLGNDAVFCSVMPYTNQLESTVMDLEDSSNDPQITGPLDQRLIQLAMAGERGSSFNDMHKASWLAMRVCSVVVDAFFAKGSHLLQLKLYHLLKQQLPAAVNPNLVLGLSHALYWLALGAAIGYQNIPTGLAIGSTAFASLPVSSLKLTSPQAVSLQHLVQRSQYESLFIVLMLYMAWNENAPLDSRALLLGALVAPYLGALARALKTLVESGMPHTATPYNNFTDEPTSPLQRHSIFTSLSLKPSQPNVAERNEDVEANAGPSHPR